MGLTMIDGMSSLCTLKLNFFLICPFLMTRPLDCLDLNFILEQVAVSSTAVSTHLACTCVLVVIVRSSMNPVDIPEAVNTGSFKEEDENVKNDFWKAEPRTPYNNNEPTGELKTG